VNPSSNKVAQECLIEHFERLLELPEWQRESALSAWSLDEAQRQELLALLAADGVPDALIEAVIASSASQALQSIVEGECIGAWRVRHQLGAGGMGTVYLVERVDGGFHQYGALKLLRGFPTDEAHSRLRRERQLLAQLQHPGIARLIDGGETRDGQPYLVMEYVDGEPLTTYAAQHRLSREARIELIDRVGQALAHAHQHLVIHRDLKSANVLVGADGSPKLLDFGVAKLVDINQEDVDIPTTRVWTSGYASPEQREGKQITTATDVFGLGTLLRELLSGTSPHGTALMPELDAVAIDADLGGILNMATATLPGDRYAGIDAFRDDLERWRIGIPVRAQADSRWYRLRKFVARHKRAVSVLLLVMFGLMAFVLWIGIERQRTARALELAEGRRLAAEQAAQLASTTMDFFGGLIEELSPDGNVDAPITLRRWLAQGRDRVIRELPDGTQQAPIVNAYLGTLYEMAGQPQEAEPLLRTSLEEMRKQGLDRDVAFARTARSYAYLLAGLGRQQDSLDWLQRSAAGFRAQATDEGLAQAVAVETYALILTQRYAQAEHVAKSAIAAAVTAQVAPIIIATLEDNLAAALMYLERPAEQLAVSDQAMRLLRAAGLERSMYMYRFEEHRGQALTELQRPAEALLSFDHARAIHVLGRGEAGSSLSTLDEKRADALQSLGRLAAARTILLQVQRREKLAGLRPQVRSQALLASAYGLEGDWRKAAAVARGALADTEGFAAMPGDWAQSVRMSLARILALAGDMRAARTLMEDEFSRAGEPALLRWRLYLAEGALQAGDLPQAEQDLLIAAAAIEQHAPSLRPQLRRVRGLLALAQGQLAAAEQDLTELPQQFANGPAYRRAIAQVDMAMLRHAQGRDEQARQLLAAHLPSLGEAVLPSHPDFLRATALAQALAATPAVVGKTR